VEGETDKVGGQLVVEVALQAGEVLRRSGKLLVALAWSEVYGRRLSTVTGSWRKRWWGTELRRLELEDGATCRGGDGGVMHLLSLATGSLDVVGDGGDQGGSAV
jgi:hypothetical protein